MDYLVTNFSSKKAILPTNVGNIIMHRYETRIMPEEVALAVADVPFIKIEPDINSMNRRDLLHLAKEKGIEISREDTKEILIQKLNRI